MVPLRGLVACCSTRRKTGGGGGQVWAMNGPFTRQNSLVGFGSTTAFGVVPDPSKWGGILSVSLEHLKCNYLKGRLSTQYGR